MLCLQMICSTRWHLSPGLEQQISSAILAPDAMADTASHTLNELRKKIRATENSIRDRLESMVRNMVPPSICRRVWSPFAMDGMLCPLRASIAAR